MLFRGFFALHFAGNIGSKVIKFFSQLYELSLRVLSQISVCQ